MEIQTNTQCNEPVERKPKTALEILQELRDKRAIKCPNPCSEVLEDGLPCTNCYAQKPIYEK
ncbi:hypothetical protein KY343_03945 [Candidatus Woesearchaeota archaeon]|nr:hypothetical protein [Candidatus Woesearchaeota archaeon]